MSVKRDATLVGVGAVTAFFVTVIGFLVGFDDHVEKKINQLTAAKNVASEGRFDMIEYRIDGNDRSVEGNRVSIKETAETLKTLDGKVAEISGDIKVIKTTLEEVRSRL